jgi:hypothetical protein
MSRNMRSSGQAPKFELDRDVTPEDPNMAYLSDSANSYCRWQD